MMVNKNRVPNLYRQHDVLDEATAPFVGIPGRLFVAEDSHSPDWWFTFQRQDGSVVQRVLTGDDQLDTALAKVIQDGVAEMLTA